MSCFAIRCGACHREQISNAQCCNVWAYAAPQGEGHNTIGAGFSLTRRENECESAPSAHFPEPSRRALVESRAHERHQPIPGLLGVDAPAERL
eukprot:849597-Pyramimonas_sp.AAC.1